MIVNSWSRSIKQLSKATTNSGKGASKESERRFACRAIFLVDHDTAARLCAAIMVHTNKGEPLIEIAGSYEAGSLDTAKKSQFRCARRKSGAWYNEHDSAVGIRRGNRKKEDVCIARGDARQEGIADPRRDLGEIKTIAAGKRRGRRKRSGGSSISFERKIDEGLLQSSCESLRIRSTLRGKGDCYPQDSTQSSGPLIYLRWK